MASMEKWRGTGNSASCALKGTARDINPRNQASWEIPYCNKVMSITGI